MSSPSDPVLTVLTPTWNRRHLLPRLYASLVSQAAPEGTFEWLVVDDGSTDGSADWLESLVPDAPFPIRVIRQENGGKHRALNRAAPELHSPWVLIVDSDDWLLPGGIARALNDIERADPETLAIIAPCDIAGREPRWFRLRAGLVDFREWMKQKRRVGDTSDFMRSRILRDFPFPVFDGEGFISEGVVWSRAFRNGGVRLSNERIVGCEYQEDGLSANSLRLRTGSPQGAMATYLSQIQSGIGGLLLLRAKLNYHRFYWHGRRMNRMFISDESPRNLLFLIGGYLLYLRDRQMLAHGAS